MHSNTLLKLGDIDMKYTITIHGYGSDSAFYSVTKQAKKFWNKIINSEKESLLTDYLWGDADESEIPADSAFLNGETEFDAESFIGENYSVELNNCYVVISDKNHVEMLTIPFINLEDEDYNFIIDWLPQEVRPKSDILHVNNMTKGVILTGEFEDEHVDISKLRFKMQENIAGDSMIVSAYYRDKEIENYGSDERGKGRIYNII